MKVFIAFACLCVCAQANLLPATIATKLISTGESSQSRTQDAAGNYAFAYKEQGPTGGSSRKEAGDAWGNKQGSYTLNVADGRQRVVKYVADGAGFRAAVATNEPGTAAQSPADVAMSSPYAPPAPVEPIAHAPALLAPAAPLALAAPAYGLADGLAYSKGLALAAPVAVAEPVAVPLLSSYSTSINHAAPVLVKSAPALALDNGLALGAKGYY